MVNHNTNNYTKNRSNSNYGNSYKNSTYKGKNPKFIKNKSYKFTKVSKPKLANLAIVTGGTGGHIFPAQVLANHLQNSNYQVQVLLDNRAKNYQSIWDKGIKLSYIQSLGLNKKNIFFMIFVLYKLFIGFCQSVRLFLKNRPACLISFGGYMSVPPVMAAIILRIPIIMHEQNAYLGKAHKLFVKYAKVLALTFTNTQNIPAKIKKLEVTGLPIRLPFYLYRNKHQEKNSKFTVVILGGSLGAKIFGSNIVAAFSNFSPEQQEKIQIYHQVRSESLNEVKKAWKNTKVQVEVQPFFNNNAEILWQSDLVIARSGASTVKEVELLGKFAIYIPFAAAAGNHQVLNANKAKELQEAEIILEQDFTSEVLFTKILNIFKNQDMYYNKAMAIKNNAIINATERLTNLIVANIPNAQKET